MILIKYTRDRLISFLKEITSIKECEFPYRHSDDALVTIENYFLEELIEPFKILDNSSDHETIKTHCFSIINNIFTFLPILGFILRSTDIRNSFELFGPLLRLTRKLMGHHLADDPESKLEIKLVLSSDWEYSPYVYSNLPEFFSHFVLIGLPSPESSNPLLIPLAGHELGHLIWIRNKLSDNFNKYLQDVLFCIIHHKYDFCKKYFPYLPPDKPLNFNENNDIYEIMALAFDLTISQAEESFCDYVGLKIFHKSYLCAFAYLLSPKLFDVRSVRYPSMLKRVRNLIRASDKFNIPVPPGYVDLFDDAIHLDLNPSGIFLLDLADEALNAVVDKLILLAESIVIESGVLNTNDDEIFRIYNRFKQIVPAEDCRSFQDIISAAWRAYEDEEIWKDRPKVRKNKNTILKDLVLKNIEVFEIENLKLEA